jgi:DNA polymerase-3 subunit epsilon
MKLFFFDVETTGLFFNQNGIHQLSGEIVIDGVTKETFDFKIRPLEKHVIEEAALNVACVTKEQIMSYPENRIVFNQINKMLDKYVNRFDKADKMYLVGFNNTHFDDDFLRQFFIDNGNNYFGSYFFSNALDVMTLATPHLMGERPNMPNFKLSTVASQLGIKIEEEKLHDASYDIYLTKEIYTKTCNKW